MLYPFSTDIFIVGSVVKITPPTTRRDDMSMSASSLFLGLLLGSIGVAFVMYGKKQRVAVPLVCGMALIVFPYFVSSTVLLIGLGIVLIAIPYFVRI